MFDWLRYGLPLPFPWHMEEIGSTLYLELLEILTQ
jgi:hypothetical protein